MSTCNLTQTISENECIGDSLVKINTNFGNLDTSICSLSSLEASHWQSILAKIPGIAKAWVNFDATKNTTGTAISDNQYCLLRSSYNVSYVQRISLGEWNVVFDTPMNDNQYVVQATTRVTAWDAAYNSGYIVGVAGRTPVSSWYVGCSRTPWDDIVTTNSVRIQCMTAASQNWSDVGDLRDDDSISITIYGN